MRKRYRDPSLRKQVPQARQKGILDRSGRPLKGHLFQASRATVVREFRRDWSVKVPNGKGGVVVSVNPYRVGKRFGQFAPTKAWYKRAPVKAAVAKKGKAPVKKAAPKK